MQGALKQVPTLDPKAIEDAIVGCAMPEGEQGLNSRASASLLAGLPKPVGGITVNRFCASGLSAVQMAADRIRVGEADVMIAGGAEIMSMVPMGGNKPSFNPRVFARDENVGIAYGMGLTAEKVAQQWKVSREAQDAFALDSHLKALTAHEGRRVRGRDDAGRGRRPLPEPGRRRAPAPRRAPSRSTKARVPTPRSKAWPSCGRVRRAPQGSVTAGNSSQTTDGAGALILASEKAVKQFDLTPLARFVSFAAAACRPRSWASARSRRSRPRCKYAGLTLADIDWIELNEAFAAQSLAVINTLGLDPAKVNPMGGAIALGHPLGATGAIRAATVVHALRRNNLKYGMVTMCVGTGQGAAGIFERV